VKTPGLKVLREIGKERLVNALNEDVDFAGTTETASRVKGHNNRLAGPENFQRALSDFSFQATSA